MAIETRKQGGVVRFAQESWAELRKVTWPTREQVIRLTLLVILISFLIAVYIFLFDNIFHQLVDKLILGVPDVTPAPPTQ